MSDRCACARRLKDQIARWSELDLSAAGDPSGSLDPTSDVVAPVLGSEVVVHAMNRQLHNVRRRRGGKPQVRCGDRKRVVLVFDPLGAVPFGQVDPAIGLVEAQRSERVGALAVGSLRMDRAKFIEEYTGHLRSGQAAAFIGAGVSMGAGYPSWSTLLKDIAKDLKLDLKREPDLPGLVQFHLNNIDRKRTTLIQTSESHFLPEKSIPAVLRMLLGLPRYREDMIRQAGVIVFVGGMREQGGGLISAPGVISEFNIAAKLGRFPIPVGATGGAAAEIWSLIDKDYENYVGRLPRKLFKALNASGASVRHAMKRC